MLHATCSSYACTCICSLLNNPIPLLSYIHVHVHTLFLNTLFLITPHFDFVYLNINVHVHVLSLCQAVYVMPSTSGRAASHPRRVDKLKFFHELKQLRDDIKSKKRPLPNPPTTGTSSTGVLVMDPTGSTAQVTVGTTSTLPCPVTTNPPVTMPMVSMVNPIVVPPIISGVPIQGVPVPYSVIQQGV